MEPIKDRFERAVGENFIRWYNQQNGTSYTFCSRQENPDLTYRDGENVLHIEVTAAYYDEGHAKLLWQNERGVPDALGGWGGINFDKKLIGGINKRLIEKCANDYGRGCVLVIDVTPILTGADELEVQLDDICVPTSPPFAGIYLTGSFPVTSTSPGGYHCWQLVW